jgi:hypothetical protein
VSLSAVGLGLDTDCPRRTTLHGLKRKEAVVGTHVEERLAFDASKGHIGKRSQVRSREHAAVGKRHRLVAVRLDTRDNTRAVAEGFPAGSVIFLDVEHHDTVERVTITTQESAASTAVCEWNSAGKEILNSTCSIT